MQKQQKIFFIGIVLLILILIVVAFIRSDSRPKEPGKYDNLALCLKEKGALFYGTFWCKYCQAQKKLFESSAQLIPYEECSTADGQAQTQICKDKNITSYPTWIFADGSILKGVVSLEDLAEKTECSISSESETINLNDESPIPVNEDSDSTIIKQ